MPGKCTLAVLGRRLGKVFLKPSGNLYSLPISLKLLRIKKGYFFLDLKQPFTRTVRESLLNKTGEKKNSRV
jgi:hypothetical protein